MVEMCVLFVTVLFSSVWMYIVLMFPQCFYNEAFLFDFARVLRVQVHMLKSDFAHD